MVRVRVRVMVRVRVGVRVCGTLTARVRASNKALIGLLRHSAPFTVYLVDDAHPPRARTLSSRRVLKDGHRPSDSLYGTIYRAWGKRVR